MMDSTSVALASFSKSGGLHELRHARVPSAMTTFRVEDLSLMFWRKYVNTDASCADWIIANIEALARLIMTLFVRAQSASRVGINKGRSCSNSVPITEARVLSKSIGTIHNLVRSEFMALTMGLCDVLIELTSSEGATSYAPSSHILISSCKAFAILSQVSSVSSRWIFGRNLSNSYRTSAAELSGCSSLYK